MVTTAPTLSDTARAHITCGLKKCTGRYRREPVPAR